jgi:formylglycine-generating enzyme
MKTTFSKALRFLFTFCVALWPCAVAQAAAPVITSFSGNGVLVCSNLAPGSVATVEWAPTVTGPWTNNWAGLDAVTVDSNGMVQASVPIFYRVRGTGSVSPGTVLIPAGSFTMGNCMNPSEGLSDELPLHTVHVSAFYMDTNLVTYSLWASVRQWAISHGYNFDNAGSFKAVNHPVRTVNWYDVVKWCNARSEMEGRVPCYYTNSGLTAVYETARAEPYVNWTANGYRLPTEAEWEKAARGGVSGHRFPWSDADTIDWSRANYYAYTNTYTYDVNPTEGNNPAWTSGGYPYISPVGSFAPNGYGLYDMAGNLQEWCWDWYDGAYYSSSPATDPHGPASSPDGYRVLRGGAWLESAWRLRCACRFKGSPWGAAYYYGGFHCVTRL